MLFKNLLKAYQEMADEIRILLGAGLSILLIGSIILLYLLLSKQLCFFQFLETVGGAFLGIGLAICILGVDMSESSRKNKVSNDYLGSVLLRIVKKIDTLKDP